MKIKYDMNIMAFMSSFEKITHAKLKDCFVDSNGLLTFAVLPGWLGKAIGKGAVNVKKLENALKRKIKIVEFNLNDVDFVRNLAYPLKVKEITKEDDIITIIGQDTQTKGLLIGKNGANLRNMEAIVKRYFDVKEIKVK